MDEALEDDVHVAGGPHIVDPPNTARATWCFHCICRDEPRILLDRVGEKVVEFSLSS